MSREEGPQPIEQNNAPSQHIPTIVAAYVAALALVTYPVGFLTLWIQIAREYALASSTALHAASLIPVLTAAARSLNVLDLALATSTGVGTMSAICLLIALRGGLRNALGSAPETADERARGRVRGFLQRYVFSLLRRFWSIPGVFILLIVTQAAYTPFLLWDDVRLESAIDYVWFAIFLMLVLAGGGLAAYLSYNYDKAWGGLSSTLLVIYVTGIASAMALTPLQPFSLPTAKFSDGPLKTAPLVSHKEGYWYVIEANKKVLTAVPDDVTGGVEISSE